MPTHQKVVNRTGRFRASSFRFLSSFVIRHSSFLVLSLLLTLATRAPASPRLEIANPVWDFGTLTNVSALTHQFIIRNTGDTELQLTKVVSSCEACLQASTDHATIAPGGVAI